MSLQAPFPWFGGKSRASELIWSRIGNVPNWVEPFFGSGAVLLNRPHDAQIETVNDKNGFISNFWRAVTADPEQVAHHADWPVNENDQHARHIWLVGQRAALTARLEGDPEYFDVKIAGWWVWGICCWIGGGWCSGEGPWSSVDGQMTNTGEGEVKRQRVHLFAQGVHRKLVHLGDAGRGVHRQIVHLGNAGQGVSRRLPMLIHHGNGVHAVSKHAKLTDWFTAIALRLRYVRVCCGDWTRVCGPTPTVKQGLTGILLDPPYGASAGRTDDLYAEDSGTVAEDVRQWAIAHGGDQRLRIALCGYDGEHAMPDSWERVGWKAAGGYGSQGTGRGRENAAREVIWFSPACLSLPLFAAEQAEANIVR